MSRIFICLVLLLAFLPASCVSRGIMTGEERRPIDFESLLQEMSDLARLARMPEPGYRTIQFSSYDRRSTSPEAPDWYSNADGFGREPIPGFARVLEEAGENGEGLYLVAEVDGPGAIVRGWSAGMGGVLTVTLDGEEEPLFEGPACDFLARRSRIFMKETGINLECGDAFCQQDADYLPIPFGKSLRVTWRGKIKELHFYHLDVRLYEEGVRVRTFDLERDLSPSMEALQKAVRRLAQPESHRGFWEEKMFEETIALDPNGLWDWEWPGKESSGAITEFSLRLTSANLQESLRGTLLRISFDGAHKPQVEAPVGDFFGSGPGINLFNSPPMTVAEDGTMTCRFVMPFRRTARITLLNATGEQVKGRAALRVSPWSWDERSLYFRAKWRSANLVDLRQGPFDMPYIMARGEGRFVGAACMVVNPSSVPHPYGSWWGEGDEKIFVDDETFPSFFGTGSEDYYNYSWSRPDLFDHPYCGQPLNSGPGNQGYCSNHRWHIIDSIPFQKSILFSMEVWHHSASPGLCYSCIGYHYARPGAIDDHRRIRISELLVQKVQSMEPEPKFGAHKAVFHHFEDMEWEVEGGATGFDEDQVSAARGRLFIWRAKKGDKIRLSLPVKKEGEFHVSLVAAHWPESGELSLMLDNAPLTVDDLGGAALGEVGRKSLILRSFHARRLLSTRFKARSLKPGKHELILECLQEGRFGFDYLWVK